MNDSFLEDLELIPSDSKQVPAYPADRHVTTRNATSSPLQSLADTKLETLVSRKIERSGVTSAALETKHSNIKESSVKDSKKLLEFDVKKQAAKVRPPERKEKLTENKLKPVENKVRIETKELEPKDGNKQRVQDTRGKVTENKNSVKVRSRRSEGYKENNQSPDVSSKENNRPPDSSKGNSSQMETSKETTKKHEYSKKSDSREKDPIALLNAIKDLISTYTKQESITILRAMQDLHLNSQANLIKNLIFQTDDLVKEIHLSRDSDRVKNLIEENERLQEDIMILQKQNSELQKKLEEFEHLKQENIALKLKCKELTK